jgi:hypothetical protein
MFSRDPREITLAALLWSKLLFSLSLASEAFCRVRWQRRGEAIVVYNVIYAID